MYSIFKTQNIRKFLTVLICLPAMAMPVKAQLNQTVSVLPPYSAKLSDYIAAPGKISSIITVTALDYPKFELYIRGSIMSMDESVIIRTRSDYKPAAPIVINTVETPSARIFQPYMLTYSDILRIFDERHLEYKGITREQVMRQGLPENTYQICFSVYDYETGRLLSGGDACSNVFSVSSVEAPLIIQPLNNTSLRGHETKNLVFSWTRPPNAPINTQYKLKIIELNSPDENYRDKIRSAAYPVFFETAVTGNVYLYSAANPQLTEGKTYAFVIAAVDPAGGTAFRNNGFSEVQIFTCPPDEQTLMSGTLPGDIPAGGGLPQFQQLKPAITTPPLLKPTVLKGTLKYGYFGKPEKYPLKNAAIRLVTKYIVKYADGTVNEERSRRKINDEPYVDGKEVAVATTDGKGDFSFAFLMGGNGEALKETVCSDKIARLHTPCTDDNRLLADGSFDTPRRGPNPDFGAIESSAGNSSCKLYLGYAVEITGEHGRYYLNPDQDSNFFFEVNPGEANDVGEVTSFVRTVNLNITVKSEKMGAGTINSDEGGILSDMDVYVYRKVNFDYPPVFPEYDVTPEKTDPFPPPAAQGMVCVGKGLTGKNGVAEIESFVLNDNPTYQYFIYIRNNTGNYNYESDALRPVNFEALINAQNKPEMITVKTYDDLLNGSSASSFFSPGFDGPPKAIALAMTEELRLKFPTLRVILTENEGNRKINNPQTTVILKEEYTAGNQLFEPGQAGELKTVGNKLAVSETRYATLCFKDTGTYELKYVPVELQVYPQKIVGPKRTITVKSPGFADTVFTVKEIEGTVKPLYFGEKFEMAVMLRYGALFEGTVYEGGTNRPLPYASVNILGETATSTVTGNDGKFRMEVRKLNTPRKIVISKDGYMPDTVTVTIDKDANVRNFELFRKARRLRVEVRSGSKRKEGIVVTLPGVPLKWNSAYGQQLITAGNSVGIMSLNITPGTVAQNRAKLAVTAAGTQNEGTQIRQTQSLFSALEMKEDEPYSLVTGDDGYVDFEFAGGSEDNNDFKVVISNSPASAGNYPAVIRTVTVPYSGELMGTLLQIDLPEGGCLSGAVYLGETGDEPLEDIDVTATIQEQDEKYTIKAKTGASGNYTLRNLPVNRPFTLQVSTNKEGSNYVGHYDDNYVLTKKGADCHTENFHMTSVDGVDLSVFMGFKFGVSACTEQSGGNYLLTGTVTLPGNTYFKEQTVDIVNVNVKKSAEKNSSGNFLLVPSELPFVTDVNNLTVSIGNYNAVLTDASGLKFDLRNGDPSQGELKAGVQIYGKSHEFNSNFGGYGYSLPDLYLTREPGGTNTLMTVFSSDGAFTPPDNSGFYLSDGINETLTYSIDGFQDKALAQPDKSYFNKTGLSLRTKLKATIAALNPSDFEIDAGTVSISKDEIKAVNQKAFDVAMGQWTLKCNTWNITGEGVKVSAATLSTGVDVQVENLKFNASSLVTSDAVVHLDKLKLLGVKEVNINTANKGLVYEYLRDGVYGWKLYATPEAGQTAVASLQGLPGVAPADRVEFISIDINSAGESYFALHSRKFRLFNMVDFTPFPSTYMYVTASSLKLMGIYDFGIPEYEKPGGAMGFYREGNSLAFKMMDMEAFLFTRHNVRYNLTAGYMLSDKLFIAKGTAEEPGNLPMLHVTMRHTPLSTQIDIDAGQKLPMGEGKELADLVGGIHVANKQWDVLRFEGILKGMDNIAAGQKMNFEVKGAVTATGQQINMSDIPSFPGLTITYDLPNSRFIGSASLDMNLSGFILQGSVSTVMDNRGWLFNASGLLEIPGVGSANLYGLFGNYTNMPPEVSSRIGDAVCLPDGFKTNLNGFFLSAGLTRQILPKVSYDYGIVSIKAGVDVSVNARTFMKFGQGTTFGLGVLAEGHAYLSGSSSITCTSVNAGAKLQLGISGDYNTQSHVYNMDGCTSLSLKLSASQCAPVLVGCSDPCASITLADFTIGANVHLDNHSGFSMGITTTDCDQQCKK
jgi:TANFOR domain-containing protein